MQDNKKNDEAVFPVGDEVAALFRKVAMENGTTAEEVLADFIKDYVVSEGHPEQVVNIWPWSRKG